MGINPVNHRYIMKKSGLLILAMALLVGCADSSTSVKIKMDSLGKKFDSSAERIWDSTKAKAKGIKEDIKKRLEEDSSKNKINQ